MIGILFIIFSMLTGRSLGKTIFKEFTNCEQNTVELGLFENNAIQLTGSIVNEKEMNTKCNFLVLPSESKSIYVIFFHLVRFSVASKTAKGSVGMLTLKTYDSVLYTVKLIKNTEMSDINLSLDLADKMYNWTSNIFIEISLNGKGRLDIGLMMANYYYCTSWVLRHNFLKCENKFLLVHVCIPEDLICDSVQNCLDVPTDEIGSACSPRLSYYIFIIIVFFLTIISIGVWLLFRIIPCIRSNPPRANQDVQAFTSWMIRLNERPTSQISISTPDGVPVGPPIYSKKNEKSKGMLALPPNYSEENQVGVSPSFFKRFFGRDKYSTETRSSLH